MPPVQVEASGVEIQRPVAVQARAADFQDGVVLVQAIERRQQLLVGKQELRIATISRRARPDGFQQHRLEGRQPISNLVRKEQSAAGGHDGSVFGSMHGGKTLREEPVCLGAGCRSVVTRPSSNACKHANAAVGAAARPKGQRQKWGAHPFGSWPLASEPHRPPGSPRCRGFRARARPIINGLVIGPC